MSTPDDDTTGRRPTRPRRGGWLTALAVVGLALAGGAGTAGVTGGSAAAARGSATTVEGATTPVGAPTVAPGRWQDQFDGTDPASRFYRIERQYVGSTVVVTTSTPATADSSSPARVEFQKLDGTGCYGFSTTDRAKGAGTDVAVATSGPVTSGGELDPESGCTDQRQLVLEITAPGTPGATPVVFTVVEVPAATNATSLPKPPESVPWADPTQGTDGPEVSGGTDGEAGPLLEPGTYRSSIEPGQTRVFRVRAGWGQSVSAGATVALPKSVGESVGDTDRPELDLTILGPNGASAQNSAVSDGPVATTSLWAGETEQLGAQTLPVQYRNLAESSGGLGASQPGTFTVALRLAPGEPPLTGPVDYLLHLGVNGEVAGEPTFAPDQQIQTGGVDDPNGGRTVLGLPAVPVAAVLAGLGLAAILAAVVVLLRSWRRPLVGP